MRTAMGEAYNEGQMKLIDGREAVTGEFLYIYSLEAEAEALGVASSAVDAGDALQAAIHYADSSKGTSGLAAIGNLYWQPRIPLILLSTVRTAIRNSGPVFWKTARTPKKFRHMSRTS